MGKKCWRFLSLPVISVLSLMSFIHYSTVFVFLDNWFGLRSAGGLFNAILFCYFAFMCFCSFGASVLIDPGQVPASFTPDVEGSNATGVRLKFCEKCNGYKPPRAHHCRVCKRCILKMDHHCLWISNCVGYSNYKPFVAFLLYATVSCIYATAVFIGSSLQDERRSAGRVYPKLLSVAFGSTVIILSLLLGTLLGWHMFLMSRNMTTIEVSFGIFASQWLFFLRYGFDLLLTSIGKEFGPCGWPGNLANPTVIHLTWVCAEILLRFLVPMHLIGGGLWLSAI